MRGGNLVSMVAPASSRGCALRSIAYSAGLHRQPVCYYYKRFANAGASSRWYHQTSKADDSLNVIAREGSNSSTYEARSSGTLSRFFQKLKDRYGIKGQQRRIILANHLFNTVARQSLDHRKVWHDEFKVDINFRARQSLLTTHIWMINRRLVHEAREQQRLEQEGSQALVENSNTMPLEALPNWALVQQEFLETFWHNTTLRIRAEGINEISVLAKLRDVQNYSLQQCMALDHVVEKIDDSNRQARVENVGVVLWSNVYYGCHDGMAGDSGVPDEYVDTMANYVLDQYDNVMHMLPTKYLMEGRVGWIQPSIQGLPPWEDSFVTKERIADKLGPELQSGWYTAMTEAGERYYWNESTGDSSWKLNHDIVMQS